MSSSDDKPQTISEDLISEDFLKSDDVIRTWSYEQEDDVNRKWDYEQDDDIKQSLTKAPDDNNKALFEKFQPGDHVIRWQMLKVMLWPIQVHGIVLSVEYETDQDDEKEEDDDNQNIKEIQSEDSTSRKCIVRIADFGYTSSRSLDEDGKKGRGFKAFKGINDMMKSYYDNQDAKSFPSMNNSENKTPISHAESYDETEVVKDDKAIDVDQVTLGNSKDGKRFHVIEITDAADLKKWHKVNYGQSLFSKEGKFDKFKKWFSLNSDDTEMATSENSTLYNENDEFFKAGTGDEIHDSYTKKDSGEKSLNNHDMTTDTNEVDRRSRWRLKSNSSSMSDMSVASASSFSSSSSTRTGLKMPSFRGSKNFLKKFTFQKKPSNYSSLAMNQDDTSKLAEPTNIDEDEPKLPKSDPRKIVLARTQYILDQQELPKSEQSLPPYHILYSNSECLAVWCKTGNFSTLQAAIFLHSTAIGNAKSTFLLTSAVIATQPWLIPVVGIYGALSVGMPYYVLNKCKDKWRESEKNLTDGFWSTAPCDVFVAAIENWSGLSCLDDAMKEADDDDENSK